MPEFWIFLTIADYVLESGTGRNPGMVQRQKTAVFGIGEVRCTGGMIGRSKNQDGLVLPGWWISGMFAGCDPAHGIFTGPNAHVFLCGI